jgi:steroid delta-isomerase-like uncharacterized protein
MSEAQENNKALVRRYFEEAWGKGNVAAVDEFMAAEYVEHPIPSGLPPGTEGLKQMTIKYRTAFPNLKATLDDIFAEGDRVAFRWGVSGTHLGDWLGIPPTGNHLRATGITVFRITDGKVVEGWTSIAELSPTEEELRWLAEGGRLAGSSDIFSAERGDPSSPIWDVLTRNLTWRLRVAEIQERERIEQELRVSRRIQQALLPETIPQLDGWGIAEYYQPAREVGGDFYDFLQLADGHLGLVVGDVSGKGIPAAVLMANTQSVLRTVVQRNSAPGQALMEANEVLCTYVPTNMFITCFYAILEPHSGRMRYANAGHDLPYMWHDGEAEELRARGMPLGLMPGMRYEEEEVDLEEGDSVLFYSDGLAEAHDPKGEMFGFPRLRTFVAEHGEEGSLGDLLMEELYSFVGQGWEQEDDITLLTLKHSAIRR